MTVVSPTNDVPADKHVSVLFVDQAIGVGGSNRSLSTVLERMTDVHRMVALVPGCEASQFMQQRSVVDELVPLPAPRWKRVGDRLRATAALIIFAWRKRNVIDAVHANGLSDLNVAVLPALLARARLVVWVHESALTKNRLVLAVQRIILRRAAVVAVSEYSRQLVVGGGLVSNGKVGLLANPIDPADCLAPTKRESLCPTAVYVGSPYPVKGFQHMPGIIRSTPGGIVDWIIVSSPRHLMADTFAELEELKVEIRDKVDDIREVYELCDIVVMPSLNESFGRVAAEAMVNGFPVVASDLPALRELLGDNEAGILVEPGNVQAFAAAVVRLAEDPELAAKLGRAGQGRAQAYEPALIADELRALYRRPGQT